MRLVRTLLTAGYPLLVYGGLTFLEPRSLALCLLAVVGLRGVTHWRRLSLQHLRRLAVPVLAVGTVLLLTALWNDARFLFLAPAIVNAALLFSFGRTLFGEGPTLVETLARMRVPDLPAQEVDYCRSVTRVWCAFFVANGAIALFLAALGDREAWALYNGVVAYGLMGLLFGVEFTVRSWRFGRYGGTLADPLFRRLFPRGPAT